MNQILVFALLGLGTGALIAGIGLAVVVNYRGSGVINLATGAVAMTAGYLYYSLSTGGLFGITMARFPAVLLALGLATLLGIVVELLVFRPLLTSSPLAKLVASLGVFLIAQAVITLVYGVGGREAPSVLPAGVVDVGGVVIPADRFWLTGIVIAVAVQLWAVYRWTRFGLATRAASENETNAALAGLSPKGLALVNTIVATLVAGLMGILASSLAQLDATTLPLQVIPALAAALFARFTSFSIMCVAGLGIGVVQSLLYYASAQPWFPMDDGSPIPGVNAMLTFVIIVVALWWRGSALPTRGDVMERALPRVPRPEKLARPTVLLMAIGAGALVVLPFDYRNALMLSMAGMVICLSYVVITGYVGQVSLMQVALAGATGFVISHLGREAGIYFPFAAIIGVIAATIVGFAAGASALRVRGVSLAVVTLAAAVAIEQFGFTSRTWGAGATGAPVAQPELFGINLGARAGFRGLDGSIPSPVLGFVLLVLVAGVALFVARLRQSGLGRRMLAVRSNVRAAAAVGVDVRAIKFAAFGISSCIAGIGGVMYAYALGSVSAERFGIMIGLSFVAYAYVGGITMISGALIGGLIAAGGLLSHVLEKDLGISGSWTLIFAGLILIVNLITAPDGIAGLGYRRRKHGGRRGQEPESASGQPAVAAAGRS